MTAAAAPKRLWWTAAALAEAGLPDVPRSKRGVNKMAARDGWQADPTRFRTRAAASGGKAQEYHWTLLPDRARKKLLLDAAATPKPVVRSRKDAEAFFETLPAAARDKAEHRLRVLSSVEALQRAGEIKNTAVETIARQHGDGPRTVWSWFDLVEGVPRAEWLFHLAPRQRAARRPDRRTSVEPAFMDLFKGGYLRLEGPSFADAYRDTCDIAEAEDIPVPQIHVVRRRLREQMQRVTMIFMREGEAGLARCFPPQVRDRTQLTALEGVNADCHQFDVFVNWPRHNMPVRVQIVVFQDLYSGKILSWRIDRSPNKVMVMAAWTDLIRDWGIPKHCLFDNGREFANKWLTGGAPTRFRFKVRPDEPLGALTMLGVQIHWATPGHGQAKPVERGFRDFAESIAKDPRFAGAYVGNRPDAKPENYGSTAVDLDTFIAVVDERIAKHNAREGRQSATCRGRSFDETFFESYRPQKMRPASEAQIRTCLLAYQELTMNPDHGRIKFRGNYYYAPWMAEHAGRKVVARFDPENLHDGLHVYATDGSFLGPAPCQQAIGFFDMTEAHNLSRQRRAVKKAKKALAAAQSPVSVETFAQRLSALAPVEAAVPQAKVVEGMFGQLAGGRGLPEAPQAVDRAPDPEAEAAHEALVASFEEARAKRAPKIEEEDAAVKFTRAIHLMRAAEAGEPISSDDAKKLRLYRASAEWVAQMEMFEIYGERMLVEK